MAYGKKNNWRGAVRTAVGKAALIAAKKGIGLVTNSNNYRWGNGRSAFVNAGAAVRSMKGSKPRTTILMEKKSNRGLPPLRRRATSGKSSGKLVATPYKMRKRDRVSLGGLTQTTETGGTYTVSAGKQVAWIGHCSLVYDNVQSNMWRLVIKKLFNKTGISLRTFSAVHDNVSAGDIVQAEYQTVDGTVVALTHNIVAGQTWDQITGTFVGDATINAPGSVVKYISYIPTTNAAGVGQDRSPARIDLEHAYITLFGKSSLKLQNRSFNGTDTQADDVDNVPLYGKTYGGKGNGVIQTMPYGIAAGRQLIASRFNGCIFGNQDDAGQNEPISQVYFPGCTMSGKALIDPGHVKTSTVVTSKVISFNLLKKQIQVDRSAEKVRSGLGEFRFFALERMLQTSTAETISLGYENNSYLSMNLTIKHKDVTIPIFSSLINNVVV